MQNIHMHKIVLLHQCTASNNGLHQAGNGEVGLHRDITRYQIFHQSLPQCLDVLFKVVKATT